MRGITKVWIENNSIAVSFDGGQIVHYEKNNGWLYVLGAIHDGTPIQIKDERTNKQDHQYDLSCELNTK